MQSAAAIVGREFQVLNAGTEREFDAAFAALEKRPGPGLIVSVDPLFDSHRSQLIALAQQHALPTVYYLREFAEGGGLVSYGASITDAYRQAGVYAGRILKGAKPADLPVQLPTRFELVRAGHQSQDCQRARPGRPTHAIGHRRGGNRVRGCEFMPHLAVRRQAGAPGCSRSGLPAKATSRRKSTPSCDPGNCRRAAN